MRIRFLVSAIATLAAAVAAPVLTSAPASAQTPAAQRTPMPIDVMARNLAFWSVNMTRDGKYITALASDGQQPYAIHVWDANDLSKPPFAFGGGSKTSDFVQLTPIGTDRLFLVFRDIYDGVWGIEPGGGKDYAVKTYVTDLKGNSWTEPGRRQGTARTALQESIRSSAASGVVTNLASDLEHVLLDRTESDINEILKMNIKTGAVERLYRFGDDEFDATIDERTLEVYSRIKLKTGPDGAVFVREGLNPQTGAWEDHPKLSYTAKSRIEASPVGRFPDGKWIVLTNSGTNFVQARTYDPVTKEFEPEVLFAHPKYDVTNVIFGQTQRDAGQILGFVVGGPMSEYFWVDPEMKSVFDGLAKVFPDQNVRPIRYTEDRNRILLQVSSSTKPNTFYILDNKKDLRLIGNIKQTAKFDWSKLRPSQWVTYTARDGLQIPGVLTLPAGWTPAQGRIPAVIVPHGGPWARDNIDFDLSGWTQFLASRGYAVLQPQYRGSAGLGDKLWKAGDEQWGKAMQDDKDDGAKWLVSQGIADPNRMAMFGYSYGGYAAFAASIRPNGLYQCAIAGAGVSDLGRIQTLFGRNRLQRQVQGWTVKGLDPIKEVENQQIPLLIYHGDRDGRVPLFHGKDYYEKAKGLGKDVEYVEIKDMLHSLLWRPEWHRQSLTAIDNYLAGPKCFGKSSQASVAPANTTGR